MYRSMRNAPYHPGQNVRAGGGGGGGGGVGVKTHPRDQVLETHRVKPTSLTYSEYPEMTA